MNRGTIRQKARRLLDENTPRFWDDADLNDYIQRGYYYYWQWLVDNSNARSYKQVALDLIQNVRNVALPADYVQTRLVEKIYNGGLNSMPLIYQERFDDAQYSSPTSGDAYFPRYSYVGTNLVFNPTPIATEIGNIRLTYVYRPLELTSDVQEPDLDPIYHDLLVLYTVVEAKKKEEAMGMGGGPSDALMASQAQLEAKFKSTTERETMQRQLTEPFTTEIATFYY